MAYYISTTKRVDFDNAVKMTKDALKEQGFGILTEIDVRKKFKEKLDTEFRNYIILGACNPPFAHEALKVEDKIGTMLPCNVIVQEINPGEIEIAAVDPVTSMLGVKNTELNEIAGKIKDKLIKAVDSLK
jgi:uncharacterized protein (DUF302 family)